MLHQNDEIERVEYYYLRLDEATDIERSTEEPMVINTEDGSYYSACLNCVQPHCIYYYDNEFICEELPGFASRQDNHVCAFGAIQWDNDSQSIRIEQSSCIECGLCASRCPFGAVYYDGNRMVVNLDRNEDIFVTVNSRETALLQQRQCIDELASLPEEIVYAEGSLERVNHVYMGLSRLRATNDDALLFCRNLMIENGYDCALSRTGVVSTRMDAVYSGHGVIGALEIEFQSDSLSVVRNLLDDIAMMDVRLGLPAQDNTPLAICALIPNTRQGFYQVCDDIDKILEIKVHTITMAALMVLIWNGASATFDSNEFCLGFRDTSIREDIEALIGRSLESGDWSGFLEPIK